MNIQKHIFAALLLLVASFASAQTVEYIHTDALGSPVAVTNASGVVIERTVYEPYGAVINRPATNGPGYTGHVLDAVTGLNYMQQRYYDPSIGAFLSVDPVTAYNKGDMRFFHRYAYAYNNPYKFTDPDGREVIDSAAEARKKYGQGTKGKGHHWVPFGSTTEVDVSSEAREVFGQSVSGEKLPDQDHLPGHSKYTDAVKGELKSYAKENKIDLSKMTANQARDFVEHVKSSAKPEISGLNGRVARFTERASRMTPAAKVIFRSLAAWGVVDYAESNMSPNTAPCRADPTCNSERAQ